MMRSLYSGVSGLKVHQTKMDVIGNNISNVNTSGFKSSRVTFNDIFSQTLSGASGPNAESGRAGTNAMQVGLGVNVSSIDINMTEGAAQRTDIASDLKIEGDGFFVVSDESGTYFTRAGAFRLDRNGTLATPSGLVVQGWPANATSDGVVKGQVSDIQIMSPTNIYVEPQTTKNIHFEGNFYTGDADATGESIVKALGFYDSLGNRFTLDVTYTYDGTTQLWTGTLDSNIYMNNDTKNPIALNIGSTAPNFVLKFDTAGKLVTDGTDSSISKLSIQIDTSTGFPVNSVFDPIEIDFTALTQFNQTTTAQAYTDNGCEPGDLTGYSIGQDGIITGSYSNGLTKIFGQIPIAVFKNPAGLEKVGDNLYVTTTNSGDFDGIGQDPTTGGGKLNQGVLEMSNVDLASEFTDMITTQRGFQANSKIITTSDEMLQTLVNMK